MKFKLKMEYNFKEREKYWQEFWEKEGIYKFDIKKKEPIFSIDTPPPYTSAARLHVGHAMSYSQAEFVVRYKRMRGFNVFYPMGFDDNGLPTERHVEKKYKVDKSKISKKEFINLCLQETKEVAETYKRIFYALGISVDWSLLYSTIDERCQRIAQRSFLDLYKKGLVERKEEPFIWCPSCGTALSQADLEDEEKDSFLNYIKFKFEDNEEAIIATTRPELIPACSALYVNSQDERYKKHLGKKAIVPLFDYEVPVLADEKVDKEFGTGIMMVCTWGDTEDITRWKRDRLETRPVISKDGRLNESAKQYRGLKINEAREAILKDLSRDKLLIKQESITHAVNVHDRCSTPAEYIITPQWFIKIAENKEDWEKRGRELKWFPQFMKSKYDAWIEGLKWDWCVSRQRYYGVPFPVYYCKDCGEILLPMDKDLPIDPMQDKVINQCQKCGSHNIRPEEDVMDTWMTSSLTPLVNAYWLYPEEKNLMKNIYPLSLRVQAFEIIRTWLFYTIVKSHYHTDSLPFKEAMISGWGLDNKGKKMSKSAGNFTAIDEVIEKYSADALRFWAAGSNLGQNLKYSEEEVKVGKRTAVKIWNSSRFVFMHLKNLKELDLKNLEKEDQWIMHSLEETLEKYITYFDLYEYSKAKNILEDFFWHKFCDNYLEFVKHRLYQPEEYGEESKQAVQASLYYILLTVLKMFAPFMPFITEEIYQEYFLEKEGIKSIHLTRLPEVDKTLFNQKIKEEFDQAAEIIASIRKYKAEKKVSLKKEIEELIIDNKNLEEYFSFFQAVMNIKKISLGKGEIKINKDVKIKIV